MQNGNTDALNQVKSEYESTLVMPNEKPHIKFMICPIGLVGSGKTTVVKPLAEKLHLVRISGDEIRKTLKMHSIGYESTWDIAQELVAKYLSLGYSMALDSDCAQQKTVDALHKKSLEYGVKLIWIHINTPEEFIINKLMNYKHTWLFKDGQEAVENYFRRKPLHQNLKMNFTYVFDTSKENLNEQIEKALIVIKKSLN